jgi:hypothetical protein
VLYELEQYETLTSKGYLDRLNAPTPWSTKMMPHHLNMVRSQCRISSSFGGGIAASLMTIRLSPEAGQEARLNSALVETLHDCTSKPGLTGAHLLKTDTPKASTLTKEQNIRGADGVADWIILLSGYDPDVLADAATRQFSSHALHLAGARENSTVGHYGLSFAMTHQDIAAT